MISVNDIPVSRPLRTRPWAMMVKRLPAPKAEIHKVGLFEYKQNSKATPLNINANYINMTGT